MISNEFIPDWSIEYAEKATQEHGLDWSSDILSWIEAARAFYVEFDHSPNTRVLVKYLKANVSQDISSMQLQLSLKGNPALILAQLAGIPKPKQCF